MLSQNQIIELFKKTGALHQGHFELSSGLHSDRYFQCALVFQYPAYAEKLAEALKEKLSELGQPDLVIGPALGGVTLAYELARAFGVRGIFTERKDKAMELRRGFKMEKGERVIVVEDVVTTGGSAQEVVELARREGAVVVGAGSIVDRSSSPVDFGVPFRPLIKMEVKTYPPAECPLCQKGIPLTKPGSKKLPQKT